jgi:hypothetical protein
MPQQLRFRRTAEHVLNTREREWEKFKRHAGISVSAKLVDQKECKRDPTEGLTYEESAVKMAAWMVVEELEDYRRKTERSVSNRNGGSHMMLDNKTEQK